MPEISSEELSDIKTQLAIIQSTGESTLAECRKTNGRVTKLEENHNSLKLDLAVLKTSVEKDIKSLDRDLEDISPQVKQNTSFIDKLIGNWQSIVIVVMVLSYLIEKFIK